MESNLSVILLHEGMYDKQGKIVTTSLTLIDVHDLARSCATYGARHLFVAHPSPTLQRLTGVLKKHWIEGYGSTYNPNRKEALEAAQMVDTLDEAIMFLEKSYGEKPTLVATSARKGENRISFSDMRERLKNNSSPHLLMLGTGWGMADPLMNRSNLILEPIDGPTLYNHLSVRSACAIMLDRLMAPER